MQHEEDKFSKLTAENRLQQDRSEQMVDQLSSEMIDTITISTPPENKTAFSRDAQLTLVLQQLEEDEVHNMAEEEQTIMRDGELATMMQHQEEYEAQKWMDKEQQAIT